MVIYLKFDEAINEYSLYITLQDPKSKRTIDTYLTDLRQYFSYMEEKEIYDIEDISSQNVMDYIDYSLNNKKKSAVARSLSAIRGMHHYLMVQYDLDKDPTLNIKVNFRIT